MDDVELARCLHGLACRFPIHIELILREPLQELGKALWAERRNDVHVSPEPRFAVVHRRVRAGHHVLDPSASSASTRYRSSSACVTQKPQGDLPSDLLRRPLGMPVREVRGEPIPGRFPALVPQAQPLHARHDAEGAGDRVINSLRGNAMDQALDPGAKTTAGDPRRESAQPGRREEK
jgi:hypothetical protein